MSDPFDQLIDGSCGGALTYGFTSAAQIEFENGRFSPVETAGIDQPHGFLRRAAVWTGDAGGGNGAVTAQNFCRIFSH